MTDNKNEEKFSFNNDSETIVKFLIEKLISLTISTSDNAVIDKKVPEYCFDKLKKSLISICELKYITHDRDDGPIPKPLNLNPPKSVNESLEISKLSEFKNSILDKSFPLNKTQLNKKPNDSFLNFSKDKKEEKEKIPFDDKNIEKINKVEMTSNNESKIEDNNNLLITKTEIENNKFYNNYYPGINFWDILPQPRPIIVDRNASTMIKFNKTILPNPEKIKKEVKEPQSKKKRKKLKKKQEEEKLIGKKPKTIVLPIEAHDIPVEQFPNLIEGEEVNLLREERKNEIYMKKIEELKRLQKEEERLQKEREKQDKLRDNQLKQITVDANGNIIQIRPLTYEQLITEFTSAGSNQREVEKIIGEEPIYSKNKISVEKNPNTSGVLTEAYLKKTQKKDDKSKKHDINELIGKKKKNENNSSILLKDAKDTKDKDGNRNSILSNDSSLPKIKSPLSIKKSTSQYAAGSNFDLMNMECGVISKEDTKYKTGGKDFFKKYQRYSIENFERQQNRTQTENFYKKRNEGFPDKENLPNDIQKDILPKTQQDFHKNYLNLEPSDMNNTLHLKTKNLKLALNALDLITESEEKEKKIYVKNKPGELFHKRENTDESYDDMNRFAKTLMGSNNWGTAVFNMGGKSGIKIPKKIENQENIISNRLRRRIPPLNVNSGTSKMSITSTSGFFKKGKGKKPVKLPKLKEEDFIEAIEKDEENEKKGYVTTHNFFK